MNVLAVGAHWDDIELGCGLTLHRLKQQKHTIYGAVLTSSEYKVEEDNHSRTGYDAHLEGTKSFEEQGIIHLPTTPLPNQQMSYSQKIMQELENYVNKYSIDLVFVHWHGDLNTDHAINWIIAKTAFRKVKNVLQYQSNAYFDNINIFTPQFFFGFSEKEYEFKKKILSIHSIEWEYRKERWEREIFDREKAWGYLCGYDYAEAFMVSKLLDNSLRK